MALHVIIIEIKIAYSYAYYSDLRGVGQFNHLLWLRFCLLSVIMNSAMILNFDVSEVAQIVLIYASPSDFVY